MSFIITVVSSSQAITVADNPEYDNRNSPFLEQSVARTVGGKKFVYDRGIEQRSLTFDFGSIDETKRAELDTFHRTHAKGQKESLNIAWDDPRPTQYGGTGGVLNFNGYTFAQSALDFRETRDGRVSVRLVFEKD